VAASLIADIGWYDRPRLGGRVLKTLCRVSLSPDSCVRQTESIFTRWGAPSLMVAKFIPGFASVATAMAGIIRLSPWRFVLFDAIGAALWSGVAITLGWIFRDAVNDAGRVRGDGENRPRADHCGLRRVRRREVVQRQRFLRQLRMDRVTVEELRERGQGRAGDGARRAFADLAGGHRADPRRVTIDVKISGRSPASAETEVVVYCACPNEATAAKVAKALVQHGFKRGGRWPAASTPGSPRHEVER
jgi:rhodanese-related sulfurtransferase